MSYSMWAKRRKTLYALGLFLIFLSFLIPTVLIWLHEPPTCFDGKQNQGETAVDMGGPCKRLDSRYLNKVKILWTRALRLRSGYYNSVTYLENPNATAGARQVPYIIRFYDDQGVLVGSRKGKTDIYPSKVFPVFDGAIDVGNRNIVRAIFEFTSEPVWYRVDKTPMEGLKITDISLKKTRHALQLTAMAKNTTIDDKADISFVAVLFDKAGTAIATSKTYQPYIRAGKSKELTFTWPLTPKIPNSVDIIPLIPLED